MLREADDICEVMLGGRRANRVDVVAVSMDDGEILLEADDMEEVVSKADRANSVEVFLKHCPSC